MIGEALHALLVHIPVALGHPVVYSGFMDHITPEFLRERIDYNPETGKLFWRRRTADHFVSGKVSAVSLANRFNGCYAGKEAFTADSGGYRVGGLSGDTLKSHRVAWAIYYGAWPAQMIDHINGDRSDNRIVNLRDATRQGNNQNVRPAAGSASRFLGVYKSGRTNKPWASCIKVDGKTIGLGRFVDEADAARAYNAAASKHFCEFASLNVV